MEIDSLRHFGLIQLQGSVKVLDIQITVGMIVNKIQTVASALVARWISIGDLECSCLISNTLLHTNIYVYLFIYYV